MKNFRVKTQNQSMKLIANLIGVRDPGSEEYSDVSVKVFGVTFWLWSMTKIKAFNRKDIKEITPSL